MTKTDIRTLYQLLALLQTDDSDTDTALARVLVTRLLRKHDAAYAALQDSNVQKMHSAKE